MYYLIRRRHTLSGLQKYRNGEVLAILCMREVIILDSRGSHPWQNVRDRIVEIVEKDLNVDRKIWYFHQITQPEYETYRDLHGFKVIKRNSS